MRNKEAKAESEICPCGFAISEHIERKPCVFGEVRTVKSLHELPIFGWAWGKDGRDLRS